MDKISTYPVFEKPFKTGKCLFDETLFIPYIITKDGKGVCFWSHKDGSISNFGNTCSDFDELIDFNTTYGESTCKQ